MKRYYAVADVRGRRSFRLEKRSCDQLYISEYFNTIFDNKLRFLHWWQRKTMEEQQELRLEVQRRTNLVEERQKPDDETTPSTATSFVPRLTTGMMLNVVNN